MSPSTLILLVLAITPSCGAGGPIPPDRRNYGKSNRGNPYESLTTILRFRKTRTAATGGAGRRAAGGHSRPPTSAPSPGPVPASYLALRCDPAWRGPAEYPRRPRRVARSDVSPPGLGPPRREVTPGTMEAAINLKIKRADARPPGIAFGFFGSSGCSEASGRRFGSRINPVRADRNSRLRRR